MRWSQFLLGAAAAAAGPRLVKRVVRTTVKGFIAVRDEMVKATTEAEREIEAKRSVTPGPTGHA